MSTTTGRNYITPRSDAPPLEETKGGVLRLSGAMETGRRGLTPYSLKEPRYLDLMKREVRDVISLNAFRQIELRVGEITTAGWGFWL